MNTSNNGPVLNISVIRAHNGHSSACLKIPLPCNCPEFYLRFVSYQMATDKLVVVTHVFIVCHMLLIITYRLHSWAEFTPQFSVFPFSCSIIFFCLQQDAGYSCILLPLKSLKKQNICIIKYIGPTEAKRTLLTSFRYMEPYV